MLRIYQALLFIGFIVLLCATNLLAQAPVAVWETSFGGTADDLGFSVGQTADGGFIVAGRTASLGAGSADAYLIKTDGGGSEIWAGTFGATGWDEAQSVMQTADGGYILAGRTTISEAGQAGDNVYLVKTDGGGNQVWARTYGGSGSDQGEAVVQTVPDNGYAIVGLTRSFDDGSAQVYLIKTDGAGNVTWSMTYGGPSSDIGQDVEQTSDGGYIIVGATASFGSGSLDVYLIKTDASGNVTWTRTYGGSDWDYGYSVQQVDDGGYIIAGETASSGEGGEDVYLIRTDSSGNLMWERTFGGPLKDTGWSVEQTLPDGGYVVAGFTASYGAGSYDAYLIRTDPNGMPLWTETFGGIHDDRGHSVQQTADGAYIVAGQTESFGAGNLDVYLLKVSSIGGVESYITGTVTANSTPLGGAIVDLYDSEGTLVESITSDLENGTYEFEVTAGDYTVELVLPLGYVAADEYPLIVPVTIGNGETITVDFVLNPIVTSAEARSKGYWKHQYNVYDRGKGNAHETLADLETYQQEVYNHFYARPDEYIIQIDGVTHSEGGVLTSEDALATLSAKGNGGMADKANAQFLALLLNVVSGKVGQYHEVTADGMTVSQAITFTADLLLDGDPSNDELAKDIAEQVNENHQITEGTIPTGTPFIAYQPNRKATSGITMSASPNPAADAIGIVYSVASPGSHVVLEIFDLAGRRIRTLAEGRQTTGQHRVVWLGDDETGRPVAPGMYFCRAKINNTTISHKLMMVR